MGWAEKDAMIWTDNSLMEHIKAWKWSRRSASLWSPRSLALMNSWGGAQCSHSEIGRMTDALALSLRPSNVNEFKWPAPYPSLSSPSLLFFFSLTTELNQFQPWQVPLDSVSWIQLGVHWPCTPTPLKSCALAYIFRNTTCTSIISSASITNWDLKRDCER